jgi:hypothetical protein
MLIILLFVILTVFTILALRRKDNAPSAKVALTISYALLIIQSIEVEHAAIQADTQRLAGGTNGWFGKWWAIAWILNVLVVISLHIYLFRTRQSKDTPNSIIS